MTKKTTVLTKCLSITLAASLGLFMTGCGPIDSLLPEAPDPRSVGVVVQNTSGTPVWSMPGEVSDAIEQASATGGTVTVTVADGSPTTEVFDFSQVADSNINRKRMQKKVQAALNATADDTGCDMLKSVETGAASLASCDNLIGLYVISNGLCDSGLLDMTSGLLVESDPEQVAEFYAAKNELADLSHVKKLSWYGMGSTSGNQPAPSNAQAAAITALWDKVLAKCGLTLDARPDAVAASGARKNAPKVGTVPFESAQTFDTAAVKTKESTTVTYTPTQLGFVGDSCEFVDIEQARAALSSVASTLRENPNLRATVIASAATHPREGYSQQLSEDRAAAVREALVAMSVPKSQVSAKGIGSGKPDDIDPATGLQIPEKSAAKRRVVIKIASV